ncbi:MAG TPA: hypothetical protein V6C78_02470, partial [Crinalium sp.]
MKSTPIFPPIALSLLVLLGSGGGTLSAIAATPSNSNSAADASLQSSSVPPGGLPESANQSIELTHLAVQLADATTVESSLPLFDRAIAIAESIDDPSAKVKTLAAIAIELAKAGQAQRSQQLFDRAERLARQ